jgi:hypothetical protein
VIGQAMLATSKRLDWDGWLLGGMGAIISGGAGAVGSGFGSMIVDPEHFNILQGGFRHLLVLMGVVFAFSAIISLMKYLQNKPVPDKLQQSLQTAADATTKAGEAISEAQSQVPGGQPK